MWSRPVPTIGDATSAAERAADPAAWAFPVAAREALYAVVGARRDVRRYRPDPVPSAVLRRVLGAAHAAPSVGHSQPWRFIVVQSAATRERAALLADRERLAQAARLDPESGRRLLDLQLEGLREAPLGVVVCCDRRTAAGGVLGRATFPDADLWSCACAIQNLWLAARAEGLGVGWVTLFRPADLASLLGLPDGVVTLGWLCVGWPDERPPSPGLERAGWSRRSSLDDVVLAERWPASGPDAPVSRLRAPSPAAVVGARDASDVLLAPPGSLGVLDRTLDRVLALPAADLSRGTLVLVGADHPVTAYGVSAYSPSVTAEVLAAAVAGQAAGAAAAHAAGLRMVVVDAGVHPAAAGPAAAGPAAGPAEPGPSDAGSPAVVDSASAVPPGVAGAVAMRPVDPVGDLVGADALSGADVDRLVAAGRTLGRTAAASGMVAVGEVGVGNTTVAAALAAALLDLPPAAVVGLGAGADSAMLHRKTDVVAAALTRAGYTGRPRGAGEPADGLQTGTSAGSGARGDAGTWTASDSAAASGPPSTGDRRPAPLAALAAVGGPEVAVLAGVTLGAAEAGAAVVLDGLATSVAALVAVRLEPAVAAHLVAGHRSREAAHPAVLEDLGLEPLLDLRIRAGEGVGACLAAALLRTAARTRATTATTRRAP